MNKLAESKTSVHVGSFSNDFMTFTQRDIERIPKYNATGCSQSLLSNRISWFFNIRGTSLTVDTACSSSLVALDLACRELWSGQASMVRGPSFGCLLADEHTRLLLLELVSSCLQK
jgi:acyl transferase domain-containing protein